MADLKMVQFKMVQKKVYLSAVINGIAAFGIAAIFGSVVLPEPWADKAPKKAFSLLLAFLIHANGLHALSCFPEGAYWPLEADRVISSILADESACRFMADPAHQLSSNDLLVHFAGSLSMSMTTSPFSFR